MTITGTVIANTSAPKRLKGAVLMASVSLCIAAAPQTTSLRIEIHNGTAAALQCQVLAAHWYSFPLLDVLPAESTTITLGVVPASKTLMDPASGLPVETVFCGRAGQAWKTRSEIDLLHAAASTEVRVECRGDVAVVCEIR